MNPVGVQQMMISDPNDEECDATGDDKNYGSWEHKQYICKNF